MAGTLGSRDHVAPFALLAEGGAALGQGEDAHLATVAGGGSGEAPTPWSSSYSTARHRWPVAKLSAIDQPNPRRPKAGRLGWRPPASTVEAGGLAVGVRVRGRV